MYFMINVLSSMEKSKNSVEVLKVGNVVELTEGVPTLFGRSNHSPEGYNQVQIDDLAKNPFTSRHGVEITYTGQEIIVRRPRLEIDGKLYTPDNEIFVKDAGKNQVEMGDEYHTGISNNIFSIWVGDSDFQNGFTLEIAGSSRFILRTTVSEGKISQE